MFNGLRMTRFYKDVKIICNFKYLAFLSHVSVKAELNTSVSLLDDSVLVMTPHVAAPPAGRFLNLQTSSWLTEKALFGHKK